MPSPRDIALAENDRSKFEPEPKDEDQNPRAKERDYAGQPAAAPSEEKPPFK